MCVFTIIYAYAICILLVIWALRENKIRRQRPNGPKGLCVLTRFITDQFPLSNSLIMKYFDCVITDQLNKLTESMGNDLQAQKTKVAKLENENDNLNLDLSKKIEELVRKKTDIVELNRKL